MRKKIQKVLAVLVAGVLTFSLAGCGQKLDATGYVQAELDLLTRHDVEQYVKELGVSEEKAEEIYDDIIDEMDIANQILGDTEMPDELEAGYEEWFLEVLSKTKYTVMEAEEVDGNYTVKVEVEPIKAFEGMADELTTKTTTYMEDMMAKALAGEEVPGEDQINQDVYNMMLEILNTILENVTYGKKVVVETRIVKNADGEYEIDEATFEELGLKLIDLTGMEASETTSETTETEN